MIVKFNYKYYSDANTTTSYRYHFEHPVEQRIAYEIEEVGPLIDEAEAYQRQGYYVALYLPYEAAPYFQRDFITHTPKHHIYAAYYVFDAPVNAVEEEERTEKAVGRFHFVTPPETIKQHIRKIQDEITAGWTYQVNYTTRLKSFDAMSISALYQRFTQTANGDYTVLIDTKEIKVASISPELFFQLGDFETNPRTLVSLSLIHI